MCKCGWAVETCGRGIMQERASDRFVCLSERASPPQLHHRGRVPLTSLHPPPPCVVPLPGYLPLPAPPPSPSSSVFPPCWTFRFYDIFRLSILPVVRLSKNCCSIVYVLCLHDHFIWRYPMQTPAWPFISFASSKIGIGIHGTMIDKRSLTPSPASIYSPPPSPPFPPTSHLRCNLSLSHLTIVVSLFLNFALRSVYNISIFESVHN